MKVIKVSILIAFFLFSILAGFAYSVWNWANENAQPVISNQPASIEISHGANTSQIAGLLKQHNIIRSALLFKFYLRFLAVDHLMKPGLYSFKGNESMSEVVYSLLKGNQITVPVTIPEGTTIKEVADILEDAGVCSAINFIEALAEPSLLGKVFSDWELIPQAEGLIFPDTYFFMKNSQASIVAERMLRLMKYQISQIFTDRLPQGLSQYEGCILASIVEKEAVLDKERPVIASVFYNRLKKQMKLETDASVQYALGTRKKRVLFEDLKIDSPYNTYLYPGLPPTPISNFGVASMKAVASPANTDYIFFVANGVNGGHNFSKTMAEHKRNTKEYYEKRKQHK